MGYDISRIIGEVDDEVICSICKDVVENPVQSNQCEHVFCKQCIDSWIVDEQTCPIDRNPMLPEHLVGVNRIIGVLLGRLKMKCRFAAAGCQMELTLVNVTTHEENCEQDPRPMVKCNKGCGKFISRRDLEQHNCVSTLLALLNTNEKKLEYLNNYILTIRSLGACEGSASEELDRHFLALWANAFPFANVRNWSHFISMPDPIMQAALKTMLRKLACPIQVIERLVASSQELSWPKDLVTLVKRANRYELCRFIIRLLQPLSSGESCVLILKEDNLHVEENLLPTDILIIFTNGVTELNAFS